MKGVSPEFKERIESPRSKREDNGIIQEKETQEEKLNPEERLYEAERLIRETVKNEMLENLKRISPKAFEEVCRRFMLALGYGYDENSGLTTQYSHDGGIDGYIYGDKLGLEKIAFQSKRFDGGTVGIKEVSSFYGVIDKEYSKGVFITTSKFSKDAIEFAHKHSNLKLIDGDTLCDLMYEYGVGVSTKTRVEIKFIDNDFFEDIDKE